MTNVTTIQLKNKTLSLEVKDFGEGSIDTEELLQVDSWNLVADIVTFPVLFNRIGNIKAEIDDLVRETKLDMDIFEAQLRQEYRKSLVTEVDDGKGKGGHKLKYPTKDEVDDALIRDKRYKVKRDNLNRVLKEADIIDSLYWSAKSKDKKLDTMSAKLKPEDFEKEILEGTINSVLIRSHKNNFVERSR
jgi:hypothetical protein